LKSTRWRINQNPVAFQGPSASNANHERHEKEDWKMIFCDSFMSFVATDFRIVVRQNHAHTEDTLVPLQACKLLI